MGEILRINDERTQEALAYFGLDNHFTIEQLEVEKYKKNHKFFTLFLETEMMYKRLRDFGMFSNKNFFAYRDEFVKDIQSKYTLMPDANDSQLFAKDITSINKEVNEYIKYASKESDEKRFRDGISIFYDNYIKKGKKFINDYLVHNVEIRNIEFRNELQKSANKMLLDMSLQELVQRLDKAIKVNYKNQTKLQTLLNNEYLPKVTANYTSGKYRDLFAKRRDMIDTFIKILKDEIKKMVAESVLLTNQAIQNRYREIIEELNLDLKDF
jgi:hypothetical protein